MCYIIVHFVFLDITSINTKTMKHAIPAKIAYLNDIKPNPAANMNMLPSNNRIIEIMLIVCLLINDVLP